MTSPTFLGPVRDELDRLRSDNERLTQELALISDTLRRRTDALGRLTTARLACPNCSMMGTL